tara:strand:- start:43 stop:396 length:354 start_codon:yes stop_codon:yes gene_type:complete
MITDAINESVGYKARIEFVMNKGGIGIRDSVLTTIRGVEKSGVYIDDCGWMPFVGGYSGIIEIKSRDEEVVYTNILLEGAYDGKHSLTNEEISQFMNTRSFKVRGNGALNWRNPVLG